MSDDPYLRCKAMLADLNTGRSLFLMKRWKRLFAQCSRDEQAALIARLEVMTGRRARGNEP